MIFSKRRNLPKVWQPVNKKNQSCHYLVFQQPAYTLKYVAIPSPFKSAPTQMILSGPSVPRGWFVLVIPALKAFAVVAAP
jgi:hypothetical protein